MKLGIKRSMKFGFYLMQTKAYHCLLINRTLKYSSYSNLFEKSLYRNLLNFPKFHKTKVYNEIYDEVTKP